MYCHTGRIKVNLRIVSIRGGAETGNDFLSPFGDGLVILQDVLGFIHEAVKVFRCDTEVLDMPHRCTLIIIATRIDPDIFDDRDSPVKFPGNLSQAVE